MHEHQRFMVRYIDRARNDGHTWGDIAEAMGLKHAAGAATWYADTPNHDHRRIDLHRIRRARHRPTPSRHPTPFSVDLGNRPPRLTRDRRTGSTPQTSETSTMQTRHRRPHHRRVPLPRRQRRRSHRTRRAPLQTVVANLRTFVAGAYEPDSCCWRTSQQSLLPEGPRLLDRLPPWGTTHGGVFWSSRRRCPHAGPAGSALPTPMAARLERSQRASRQWENRRPAEHATTDSDGGRLQSQRRSRLPSDSDTQHRDNPHRRDSETFGRSAQRAATDTDGPSRPRPVADTRRSATPITPPNHRFTFGRSTRTLLRHRQRPMGWADTNAGRRPSRRTASRV